MKIDEAIKRITDCSLFAKPYNPFVKCEYTQLAEWLKELKERREKQEWIPCSKRLPEDPNPSFTYGSKTYQVTTERGGVVALKWHKTEVRGKTVMRWEWSDGVIYHGDVLAWKPLSEPWKGIDGDAQNR